MKQPILLSLSPNENNTPARVADLMKALESFKGQIVRISDDAGQPADIMLRQGARCIHIECKEKKDIWSSKQGHIGDQLIKLLDETNEAFIIVLASLEEARAAVPTLTTVATQNGHKTQWAGKNLQESSKTSLRALGADCIGCEVPIFYLSGDRVLSFKEALSYAKNRFEGGNPFQWASRHRGKAGKIQALVGNGIGAKTAEALLDHFKTLQNIANASYEELQKVPGMGPERSISIMERMH